MLLLGVGTSGIYGIRSTNVALVDSSQNVPTLMAITQQLEYIARARLRLDRLASRQNVAGDEAELRSVDSLLAESDNAWSAYSAYPAEDDEKRIARDVTRAREDLKANGIAPMIAALKASDWNTAKSLAFDTVPKQYALLSDATLKLDQFQVENSRQLSADGAAHERMTLGITISALMAGILCAIISWWMLRNAISKPLESATEHFRAIESGDLTTRIIIERDDELGALLGNLAQMQKSLRTTVLTIREGVDLVANAAGEIASGNLDLSKRTEQQAASLEETAASMEEISATVKHNTANTMEAARLAKAVSDTAGLGFDAVKRVIETMDDLTAGSGKIADITAIIEGIAFQTNILALNAAVEAARAGEQGRGFAVVATEVRSLAQRSGTAAKEIKELITGSVSRVSAGAVQAAEAGDRMEETLGAVRRVTGLLAEISSASQEQTQGIEQVTTAVSHMDEVTQQNAALVEEATAASASMEEQSSKMRDVVSMFKLGKNGAPNKTL